MKEAGKRAGNEPAKLAEQAGRDVEEARKHAAEPFRGLRFHDLRHQTITEMAEAGASDATIMALAGHPRRVNGRVGRNIRVPERFRKAPV